MSLHLNPDPTLVPSPVSFFATYSAQLRSLPTSKIFSGCAPDFPYSVNSTYILRKNLKMMLSFSRISPGPALLELSVSSTISTSNLGTYPTLTRLVIFVNISVMDFPCHIFWSFPQSFPATTTRNAMSSPTALLNLLYLQRNPSGRHPGFAEPAKSTKANDPTIPKFTTGFVLDEWQQCLYLPCLESLVFDGPSTFFAAAASPLVVPLLHDLKVTTLDADIDCSTVVEFLTSRRDTFHSLEINLECDYQATINFHTTNVRVAGIDALLKHGAEMSVDDNFQQWIYLAKPLE
ncbi:hypothetical protein C8J57DRAFT_1248513 [Mycena rebaudengoi]|nr:hypothetical protein C8J57DRAFT_1248513 [Mycena rebaudengoi]